MDWRRRLRVDPVPVLRSLKNEAIAYFANRDLLEEPVGPPRTLWELREPISLLRRQQRNGSWRYPAARDERLRAREDYDQIETFRSLGILVEKYTFMREHPAIKAAAEFLFSRQTDEGDIRGIYGNQYSPNYTAAMMELLIKAGFAQDQRISEGFRWLLSMRQDDGGWAIPLRTRRGNFRQDLRSPTVVQPDRTKPFSHLITGVVLRAFAAHPHHRRSTDAIGAAELLSSRLFKTDPYPDRNGPEYWTRVSYPFWFTDIVSALDSLSQIGRTRENPHVREAVDYVIRQQISNGTFRFRLLRAKDKNLPYWITLAICRILRRLES